MPSFSSLHRDYTGDQLGPDGPVFLIHHGQQIVALTLKEQLNRRFLTHGEVWFGSYQDIAVWGERLAAFDANEEIPVYVYPLRGSEYEPAGQYRVVGSTTNDAALKTAHDQHGSVPLSRIVYMEKVNHGSRPPVAA